MRSIEDIMRYICIATAACAALSIVGDGVRAAQAPAATYSITDLGSLGGGRTTPMGINNRGAVVGVSETVEGLNRAFLYTAGSLIDLGTLGGDESFAYRVNDNGHNRGQGAGRIGAISRIRDDDQRAARSIERTRRPSQRRLRRRARHQQRGRVIGYYTTAGEHMSARNRVFCVSRLPRDGCRHLRRRRWRRRRSERPRQHGRVFQLEPHADYAQHGSFPVYRRQARVNRVARGKFTTARDLNNRDEVVGDGTRVMENITPSCSLRGRLRDLGTLPGGRQSAAYAINERGDIVGFSEGRDGSARAIIVSFGRHARLERPASQAGRAGFSPKRETSTTPVALSA